MDKKNTIYLISITLIMITVILSCGSNEMEVDVSHITSEELKDLIVNGQAEGRYCKCIVSYVGEKDADASGARCSEPDCNDNHTVGEIRWKKCKSNVCPTEADTSYLAHCMQGTIQYHSACLIKYNPVGPCRFAVPGILTN